MIRKLRRKFTAMVLVGLLLITAGIVFSINYATYLSFNRQVEASLQVLSSSGGRRPGLQQHIQLEDEPALKEHEEFPMDQPENSGNFAASMSNSYTVRLSEEGEILEWFSDRADLYSNEQIAELVTRVQAMETESGHVDTQYFKLTTQPDKTQLLVVLDARMERESARQQLAVSLLVGVVAYGLMSLGAIFLIRRMTRPVQEAFDKQKQFVMDASHELKTPLSVISANAEALAGEIGENQWLTYIQSEVQRTDQLVHNLLTMARMDQGSVTASRRRFDLSRAALSVALPFEAAIFEAGKRFEMEVPEGITCTGDEEMLKQLIVILLSNAVKYSDPDGEIALSLQKKGERCVLRVYNTGLGIEKDDLPKVFDRFYRVDQARSRELEGYGLGLSIAKAIVEAHRGKITAESQPGAWASFTVVL